MTYIHYRLKLSTPWGCSVVYLTRGQAYDLLVCTPRAGRLGMPGLREWCFGGNVRIEMEATTND